MGIDVQSPLGRVSEGSESDTSLETSLEATHDKRSNARTRTLERLPTLDLLDKLDEREREVQALLLAGEASLLRRTTSDSAHSNVVDESPAGFQWEVPDFSEVLGVVVRSNESLAKRGPPEDISECSPLKRTRSQCHGYEGISDSAKRLTSMMAGMREQLARLNDPQYIDDLLALESSTTQPVAPESKVIDEINEIEALRQENRNLRASLAESEREKAEMSKRFAENLMVLEDRLAKSNKYLKDAICSDQAKQPECKMSSGNALLQLKAQQRPISRPGINVR
jgi:hypothetical protein